MSGNYHILSWRDIPSMVKGKVGRQRVSRPLSNRFMEAIDAAAMRTGDTNSDDYLDHWKASPAQPLEGDAETFFDQKAAELESEYPRERLLALIKNGGWESTEKQ